MSPVVEPLAWDTEFFGVPMGRARLDDATPEHLAAIDAAAREMGIACVVGDLDPERSDATLRVQDHGHRLVEVGITFARPRGDFRPPPTDVVVRRGTVADLDDLAECIEVLAPWSRFAVDPRFGGDAARRLFRAWADRAARDDDGGHTALAVAEDDEGIVGFSTHTRSPRPRIDLMGVLHKGSGAAWALMDWGLEWAGAGGAIEGGPCAARNLAPLRFVEHCGFHAARTRYVFHRWYDGPAG